MSIDQGDDDDAPRAVAWADEFPIDGDGDFPPELQEEFDRLAAAAAARHTPPERLTPELEQLEADIGMARGLRNVCGPDVPLYMFGRFEAISSVRGGMGLVIKARDPQLDRDVAIKLWLRSGPEWQAALLAEARLLAKLKHPNVVTVYEPGIWKESHVYFVMEWIEGVDAHTWLERSRSWQAVRRVFIEAATGLAAAHDAGIQHRDFKPSNILIGDDGRVVIADFGVADSLCESPEREELGKAPGTPAYMAPERLRGMRGDARSDQFSFCATLWRALYGQRPFAGESREELIGEIERKEIRENPAAGVPLWLSQVVRKGLAVDPDERYRDMHELIAALQDEPPDGTLAGDEDDDDGSAVVDGRVLHKSGAGAVSQRERWPYAVIGFLSAAVAMMGFTMAKSPAPAPVAGAVQIEPYHAILGAVADDDFVQADRLWVKHELELTNSQSLRVARDCLKRADQLVLLDRAKADEAVFLADKIARAIIQLGSSAEAREAGGQLRSDIKSWRSNHRPSSVDPSRP
jgi:tRNA A-37 threonylcarbamoyl transferase component Bud32